MKKHSLAKRKVNSKKTKPKGTGALQATSIGPPSELLIPLEYLKAEQSILRLSEKLLEQLGNSLYSRQVAGTLLYPPITEIVKVIAPKKAVRRL